MDAFSGVRVSTTASSKRGVWAGDREPTFTELLDAINTETETTGTLSKENQANIARALAEGELAPRAGGRSPAVFNAERGLLRR